MNISNNIATFIFGPKNKTNANFNFLIHLASYLTFLNCKIMLHSSPSIIAHVPPHLHIFFKLESYIFVVDWLINYGIYNHNFNLETICAEFNINCVTLSRWFDWMSETKPYFFNHQSINSKFSCRILGYCQCVKQKIDDDDDEFLVEICSSLDDPLGAVTFVLGQFLIFLLLTLFLDPSCPKYS